MGRKALEPPRGIPAALARVVRAHLAVREEQLTQDQIAATVGVSQSMVSTLLLGRRDFTVTLVIRFASLLGLEPHELLQQAERLARDEPLQAILASTSTERAGT